MVILRQIRGQERAVGLLRRAIAAGRVPHAYLFCGPQGAGKYTTGVALAAALTCLDEPGEGCGQCTSCAKIAQGIHPDVQTLERQGATQSIPIDTIRSRVIPQLGMLPHEGRVRVFLIDEAAALQNAAANALLKTLEEPPTRTHFVLCTTAPDALLPTIRSRCQRISFVALSAVVRAELDADSDTATEATALFEQLLQAAEGRDLGSLHQAAGEMAGAKVDASAVLELLAGHFHERAVQAAMDHDLHDAQRRSHQARIVLDTQAAIAHMAHGHMALEAMLHHLRTAL
jgi:DNA polymerase-3 subunit delta'